VEASFHAKCSTIELSVVVEYGRREMLPLATAGLRETMQVFIAARSFQVVQSAVAQLLSATVPSYTINREIMQAALGLFQVTPQLPIASSVATKALLGRSCLLPNGVMN
jgi:hypothetical protein